MKKKLVLGMMSMLVLSSVFFMRSYLHAQTATSELIQSNVEALVDGDPNSPQYFIRTDKDCKYEFKGNANGKVTLTILGVGSMELKLNGDGYACYIYTDGKTHCEKDGDELCTERYCPTFMANLTNEDD